MECFVYVLGCRLSRKRHLTYVGWTNDVARRLSKHNTGKGARTTRGRSWILLHVESRRDAASQSREWQSARQKIPQASGGRAARKVRAKRRRHERRERTAAADRRLLAQESDYPSALEIFDDGATMPRTWPEWLKMAEEMEQGLRAYGHPVERVTIDPRVFTG